MYNHRQHSAVKIENKRSYLLQCHAKPVVIYNIDHARPKTHPGGLNGTFTAD